MPAPFGPRRLVTPAPSEKLTSLTATTLPYQRETCSSSMAAGAATGDVVGAAAGAPVGAVTR